MNNKYKFSVIMAVYNAEDYLRETIDCLLNQTIGFENIQLILINDGSTDSSEKICFEYLSRYPNNIIYKKKKNGGPSSARNMGLKLRTGRYINFLDSDDLLPLNTFETIYNFFESNLEEIDVVAIPLVFFGSQKGIHPKYKYFGEKDRIVDLEIEPHNFVLSTSASFYKTEVLKNIKYDETLCCEEDTKLNFTLYKKNLKFGYVCENGISYNYRKRETKDSITDSYRTNVPSFQAAILLLNYLTNKSTSVPKYIQELIIYELRFRLKNLKKNIFKNDNEYYSMLAKYRYFIDMVDKKLIAYESKWIDTKVMKYIFLTGVGHSKTDFYYSGGFLNYRNLRLFSVSKIEINVRKINYDNGIRLEITYPNYHISELDLILVDSKDRVIKTVAKTQINCAYDIYYGEDVAFDTIKTIFDFKTKPGKYLFKFIDQEGNKFPITSVSYQKTSFALKNKKIKKFLPKHVVYVDHSELYIKKRTPKSIKFDILSNIKHNFKMYSIIKKKYNYNAWYRLLNIRTKKNILLSDRPEKAQDNAEAIFRYINSSRKDIARHTYFVISKKSADYKRLKKIGKVVSPKSIKHKLLFINAKYVMCSHLMRSFFSPFELNHLDHYMDLIDYKFVWLQHGIAIPDISRAAFKYKENVDFAITSIKKEYDSFCKSDYMYEPGEVILTGMPRFDYLKNNPKKIITIIPTWREFLSGKILETGFHATKEGFEKTKYYESYSQVLSSGKLRKLLEKNDYILQFVLHPGMKGYFEYFKKFASKNVRIIDASKANYKEIFSESQLLITDYSSVFFDFSYLNKPIIFFQFDQDDFFKYHYTKPNFSYEKDGFGDIITNVTALINKITYYFDKKFKVEGKYLSRIKNTFVYNDNKNCERVIDTVIGKNPKEVRK